MELEKGTICFRNQFDPGYTEEGVKIEGFSETIGAKKGGLKVGDIIKKINRVNISKLSDLKGQLNAKRPGDFVDVIVDRNGDLITKKVKLSKPLPMYISKAFNWELKNLTKKELKKYGISHGVRIYRTNDDNSENSLKNYILLKVNDTALKDAEKAVAILDEIGKDMRYKIFIDMMNVKGEKERIRFR